MKFSQKITLLGICSLMVCLSSIITNAAEQETKIDAQATTTDAVASAAEADTDTSTIRNYIINKTAKCGKKDGLIYCVDTENNKPITGVVEKTKDGVPIRRYRLEDGYLNGTSEVCDKFGNLSETRPYVKGILHGTLVQYNRDGEVIAQIPYINGKKEGIASFGSEKTLVRTIYIEDIANGDMVVYDRKLLEMDVTPEIINGVQTVSKGNIIFNTLLKEKNKNSAIYRFEISNQKMKSGTYYYLECQDNDEEKPCIPEVVSKEIPALILYGFNQGCLKLHESLNTSECIIPKQKPSCTTDNKNFMPFITQYLEAKECQKQ